MDTSDTNSSTLKNQVWDFAKSGIAFYLLGLFVVFMYFTQLQILSVDLIKPAAIIIGIYVMVLLVIIPWLLLFFLNLLPSKAWLHNIAFAIMLFFVFLFLQWYFNGWSMFSFIFAILFSGCIYSYFHSGNFVSTKLSFYTSYNRMGIFAVIIGLLFSISLYPQLPQYLGGGKPIPVKVYPEDRQLMLSQFSMEDYDSDGCISASLLYEGNDDYYFIDEIKEMTTNVLVEFRIHKVQKKLIKKLIFRKSNWIKLN